MRAEERRRGGRDETGTLEMENKHRWILRLQGIPSPVMSKTSNNTHPIREKHTPKKNNETKALELHSRTYIWTKNTQKKTMITLSQ